MPLAAGPSGKGTNVSGKGANVPGKGTGASGGKSSNAASGKPNKPVRQARAPVSGRLAEMSVALGEVYHDTSAWNACCLPLLGGLIFCFAVALIVLGITLHVEDIIIIGAIFIFGSFLFIFLLYLNVIRPMCKRNRVSYDSHVNKKDGEFSPVRTDTAAALPEYGLYWDQPDDYLRAESRPVPTESQLYTADKSRSFLATPATTTDVVFQDGTPPPPRVKSPLRRVVSPPPKVSMPTDGTSRKKPATFEKTIDERMRRQSAIESEDMDLW